MKFDPSNKDFFEVIYVDTRKQAIADGNLVDVSDETKNAGFRVPVAVTHAVWHEYIEWSDTDNARKPYQDQSGRLWDVLSMLSLSSRKNNASIVHYQLCVIPRSGCGKRAKTITLKSVIAGGDNGEPVMTIMLPNED